MIDQLIDSTAYADFFANKWNMVLRNKKRNSDELQGSLAFYRWIWTSLYDNKPYDQFVREILTAAGDANINPAVTWYREVDETNEQVEDVAQLFLGLRIQCARCHHHPYEKWSQNDYYGLAAFFSRVGKKNIADAPRPVRDRRVFHNDGVASAQNPRTGTKLKPSGLGTDPLEIPADRDPRVYLADWLVEPANPFFARALVNRYWKHFFGRGIVEPEDDMRATNPPSNPELLDQLAAHFVASGFDLKDLVRTICQSQTYQLSAIPNDYNATRQAELLAALSQATDRRSTLRRFSSGHGDRADFPRLAGRHKGHAIGGHRRCSLLLDRLRTTPGDHRLRVRTAAECQPRPEPASTQQYGSPGESLQSDGTCGCLGRRATNRPQEERVPELYRWVYAREPDADEVRIALTHLARHESSPQIAYEDLLWALVNTREFLFNN